MSTALEATEFLPHVDAELSSEERAANVAQVRLAQADDAGKSVHPRVSAPHEPAFSPSLQAELRRIEENLSRAEGTGIDSERYNAVEAPSSTSPHSDERDPELLAEWRSALTRAYGLNTYLDGRITNLSLLETHGKNTWLIGNSQLEDILRTLEQELAVTKRQVEQVEEQRRARQDAVKAELNALEESWRKGIRGVVEVEVATESLRQQALIRRSYGGL